MELQFEEVVKAYFDCRRRKRKSLHALDFEFDLEKNLFQLYEDLIDGNYQISQSIAFVVEQPKIREIWSATFRDRVVHHVIYNRLSPRFYPGFIRNSFACIPERGSLDASNHLWAGMRSITQNWQKQSYYLGADVRNFFVSIHKPTLSELVTKKIHEPWLKNLTTQVLFHDPRQSCVLKSKSEAFARVPSHKSLWHTPLDRGLPIGNLTSQFFANVYLNELDQFVKHTLRAKYYYRYVDDFIILHESSDYLNDCFTQIERFLLESLKIELHPFKKRLGLLDQGIDFVGYFHKPYRRYPRKRTANRLKSVVNRWKMNPQGYSPAALKQLRDSVNSYYGLIRQTSSYRMRKHLGDEIRSLFVWPDEKYTKIILPKEK
jgi:retron-type reverse transcriptase